MRPVTSEVVGSPHTGHTQLHPVQTQVSSVAERTGVVAVRLSPPGPRPRPPVSHARRVRRLVRSALVALLAAFTISGGFLWFAAPVSAAAGVPLRGAAHPHAP